MENIHKGHRERLRDMALKTGLDKLPEHQALELLLSYVIPQKDTNPLAHDLINKFGSLAGVFDASPKNLMQVKGVGSIVASFLSTCAQIPQIYKNSKIKDKVVITCPRQALEYYNKTIFVDNTEKFYLTHLNSRCEVIKTESFTNGNNSKIVVDIKEIIHNILNLGATGIIICHTHPFGEAKPSKEDIAFTNRLMVATKAMGIRLLDHIIFSSTEYFSFLNENMLTNDSNIEESVKLATFETEYKKDL